MSLSEDQAALGPQIARNRPPSEFAPRRQRMDRAASEILPATPARAEIAPMSEEIVADVTRTTTLVKNCIKERNDFADALNKANARIEQFESTVTDLRSQLESARLEVAEANRRTDDQRTAAVRLKSILENIGGLVADGIEQ